MEEKPIWEKFLEFEKEHKLFEYSDKNGICTWTIIRQYVYQNLLYSKGETTDKSSRKNSTSKKYYYRKLKRLFVAIKYLLFVRGKYFFYLSSRNNIDGTLVDQHAISAIKSLNPKDCYLMESFADIFDPRLHYHTRPCPLLAKSLFNKRIDYDFNPLIRVIKEYFKAIVITEAGCMKEYHNFYTQFRYYKFLFRLKNFEKIFVTQNCMQYGMYYAAHQLGIPVYEFQHGLATKAHMAYSFPQEYNNLEDKIYVADYLLTLSPFWLRDCYNPVTRIIPVGNDYYTTPVNQKKLEPNSIVVVSANVFGKDLSMLVIDYLKKGGIGNIYFKLHPNQFDEFEYFSNLFRDYPMVRVVANEMSMQELLDRVDSVLVIQSTAVYEALYKGCKVFIYKRKSYRLHAHVFDENGVFLVDDAESLINKMEESNHIVMKPNESYFSHFDKSKFLKAIS